MRANRSVASCLTTRNSSLKQWHVIKGSEDGIVLPHVAGIILHGESYTSLQTILCRAERDIIGTFGAKSSAWGESRTLIQYFLYVPCEVVAQDFT